MEGPPGLCGHSKTTASHPVNEMTSKLFSAITTTAVMATVASLFPGDILSHLSDPPSEIITAVMTQPPPLGLHLSCPLSPTRAPAAAPHSPNCILCILCILPQQSAKSAALHSLGLLAKRDKGERTVQTRRVRQEASQTRHCRDVL